jgi:hypothetical protein
VANNRGWTIFIALAAVITGHAIAISGMAVKNRKGQSMASILPPNVARDD